MRRRVAGILVLQALALAWAALRLEGPKSPEETLDLGDVFAKVQQSIDAGEPGAARTLLERTIPRVTDPAGRAGALNALGTVAFAQHDYHAASQAHARCLALAPQSTAALANLVLDLVFERDLDRAEQVLESGAAKRLPRRMHDTLEARLWLARQRFSDTAAAIVHGTLDVVDPQILAVVVAPIALGNARQRALAQGVLQHWARTHPHSTAPLLRLARFHLDLADDARARAAYSQALAIDPASIHARDGIAALDLRAHRATGLATPVDGSAATPPAAAPATTPAVGLVTPTATPAAPVAVTPPQTTAGHAPPHGKVDRIAPVPQSPAAPIELTLRMPVPAGEEWPAWVEGSWDTHGKHSQLLGYAREPMQVETEPQGRTARLTRPVWPTDAHFFHAVVRDRTGHVLGEAHFHIPFTTTAPVTVTALPIVDPDPALSIALPGTAPSPAAGPTPWGGPPRAVLVLVDSATWQTVMPAVRSHRMPYLEGLLARAAYGIVLSDPPLTAAGIARINTGASTSTAAGLVGNSLQLLSRLTSGDLDAPPENTAVDLARYPIWVHLAGEGHTVLYVGWESIFRLAPGGAMREGLPVEAPSGRASLAGDRDLSLLLGGPPGTLAPEYAAVVPATRDFLAGFERAHDRLARSLDAVRPRWAFLHINTLDEAYHALWNFAEPLGHPAGRASLILPRLHCLLDRVLASLLSRYDLSKDTIMIASDHGAASSFFSSWFGHDIEGLYLLAGAGVRPGLVERPTDLSDLLPTLLAAQGERAPAGFPGKVIEEAVASR